SGLHGHSSVPVRDCLRVVVLGRSCPHPQFCRDAPGTVLRSHRFSRRELADLCAELRFLCHFSRFDRIVDDPKPVPMWFGRYGARLVLCPLTPPCSLVLVAMVANFPARSRLARPAFWPGRSPSTVPPTVWRSPSSQLGVPGSTSCGLPASPA